MDRLESEGKEDSGDRAESELRVESEGREELVGRLESADRVDSELKGRVGLEAQLVVALVSDCRQAAAGRPGSEARGVVRRARRAPPDCGEVSQAG